MTHKLVTIIGIHAHEVFLRGSEEEALREWKRVKSNPDFVAGALFKGGQIAPLSGQEFRLVAKALRGKK